MNHLKPVLTLASALAVMANSASSQMMMRQALPPQNLDMHTRDLMVTEDHWISSIVDRWTSAQRISWQSLDSRFRSWASHLVWMRKNAGHLSAAPDLEGPLYSVPAACAVATFASPAQSVAESMGYFREVMPDVNWHAWNTIEPKFREIAEWEMSVEHARAQRSKAEKRWWDLNGDKIQSCLQAAQPSATRTASTAAVASTGPESMPQPSPRVEEIDRRAKAELKTVEHMTAPEPIKQEAREQATDAAAIARYIAEVDQRRP